MKAWNFYIFEVYFIEFLLRYFAKKGCKLTGLNKMKIDKHQNDSDIKLFGGNYSELWEITNMHIAISCILLWLNIKYLALQFPKLLYIADL